ncbi:putative iron-regulated protein [Litorivivens lipolytica]|uniref:Putative iron-regulated protein n=1 Tax=Litorivivens lipolytica TaxID=1524264 RepID=A0A7W4Z7U3_9GAMM|nr:imelysin family protein [Litorivivens lipolytica]MBB3048256.1 putative iron-regulated protein [Litorivivens lipolytica]
MPVFLRFFALVLLFSASLVRGENLNTTYITLASAVYEDSLISARDLQSHIDALLAQPSPKTLSAARDAWRKARVPYQQSETFRFANPEIDDWEGALNAWPLDEGLIDYVSDDYFHEMGNLGAQLNIIANPTIQLAGQEIDAREISPELIQSFHEFAGSEANVASGYHAIEFLLWGQDLNGTQAGAGERPYTDFVVDDNCSNGHCERRRQYLKAVTTLLVSDLEAMVARWQAGGDLHKKYSTMSEEAVANSIVFSIGSLSLGELAGERMKVPLEANSTEDEHDCFSDNTHWSHYYNALGMQNLFTGQYQRINGDSVGGPSLADFARKRAPEATEHLRRAMNVSVEKTQALVKAAEHKIKPMKFDQMIAEGNREGRALVMNAIDALVAQTTALEDLARTLGLGSENSDASH